MATSTPPSDPMNSHQTGENPSDKATWDVELLRVLVSRQGTRVDAQWAIHPQLKQDLLPEEWKEVTDLMAKVTDIVGTRFSEVLQNVEPDPPGHA
ncbi:MAG: hypothetical protein LZF86_120008 [Nitrospira sp.]|nr:MAG: hypothetical protein LZF86_120008 [Nitrospira sp.]